MDSAITTTRLAVLRAWFRDEDVPLDQVSPNMIAKVCHDYYPHWEVTGEQVVEYSNKI